jgi:hypothetical protein
MILKSGSFLVRERAAGQQAEVRAVMTAAI